MADAFENILGQPQVREFLRATVAQGKVSHAYLFTGPAGSNKTMAAYAFAQAVLCPKGASGPRGGNCGACDACRRIMRKKHPDVRYFAPEGAGGYLVEQIRDIVADTSMAPIQAHKKVYILDRVDLLGVQAANAFLKTLEEPPSDVVLILLARTRESVLPTILSRCQVVPFRTIPASEAAGIIVQNTGASREQARMAVEACDGSITRAVEFLKSNERLAFRTPRAGGAGLSAQGRRLGRRRVRRRAHPGADEGAAGRGARRAGAGARRECGLPGRNRPSMNRGAQQAPADSKTFESLRQLTAIVRSWLRGSVMAVCAQAAEARHQRELPASVMEAAGNHR